MQSGVVAAARVPFLYGKNEDQLCLVVDRPIADRRRAMLESMGVGVIVVTESGGVQPAGQLAIDIMDTGEQRHVQHLEGPDPLAQRKSPTSPLSAPTRGKFDVGRLDSG